jgi:hypothetical protein
MQSKKRPAVFFAEERLELRQAQSAPMLAELREKLLLWKEQLLPRHPMAEAIHYALAQWINLPSARTRELTAWLPDQWKIISPSRLLNL